jgi:LmbE family N-acetylglucosaminyl deacetylase
MNVLAFFAHPDDETMLAGGVLALLAAAGARVHYLSATRGEGGEAGEPPLCPLEELGQVRADELACAAAALGGASLTFLDYVDPRVGPKDELYAFTDDLDRLAAEVAAVIRQVGAQVVIAHGSNGEYGHPAHRLAHRAAVAAVASITDKPPLLYTAQAAFAEHPKPHLMNADDPADLVLDVSPVMGQKIQAALCHRTQHALFVRRASKEAGRPLSVPEVIVSMEGLHRVLPPVGGEPQDALSELLRQTGCLRPAHS